MEITDLQIETQADLDLPWKPIILTSLADLQHGARGSDTGLFKEAVQEAIHQDSYYVGVGDYWDMASPSTRFKIEAAGFYDRITDALEYVSEQEFDELAQILEPTKGRWVGLASGHHWFKFQDGTTSDERLAELLGAPYLGTSGIVSLEFRRPGGGVVPSCQILVHHGVGSGRSIQASLRKMWPLVPFFPTVDIFLIAHFHEPGAHPFDALVPYFGSKPALLRRRRFVASSGGFMDGYVVGNKTGNRPEGTYVEKGVMTPKALGNISFTISPIRDRQGGGNYPNVDIKVRY